MKSSSLLIAALAFALVSCNRQTSSSHPKPDQKQVEPSPTLTGPAVDAAGNPTPRGTGPGGTGPTSAGPAGPGTGGTGGGTDSNPPTAPAKPPGN